MPVFALAGAAALVGSAIGSAVLVSLAVSLAVSGIAQLFVKKPEAAGAFNSSLNLTSQAPDDARLVVYGKTRLGGTRVFAETTNGNQKLYLVHVYAAHEVNAFTRFHADGEALTLDGDGYETDKFAGHLRIVAHGGAWDQAADAMLTAACPSWTTDHRLQGLAYAAFELIFEQTLYGQGIPNFTAEIEGRKVYDQRDEAQDPDDPDTWLYSDNWALCIQDYLRGVPMRDGSGAVRRLFGVNAPDDFIDLAEIAAEASICDEDVALAGGGTQKRYTLNGVVSTATEPNDALPAMLAAGAGMRIDNGGMLSLQCGAARVPVVHLSDADLRGPRALRPTRPMAQVYNGVKSTYRGPESDFVIVDVPPFQDAALVAHDGRESWLDMEQQYIDDAARGQRLQWIGLAQNRRQESGDLPLNLKGFRLRAGSWFTYTCPSRGWDHKVFVCETHRFATGADERGAVLMGVDATMQAIDEGIYAWSSDMQTIVAPAPSSDLANPFYAPDPSAISAEVIEFRDRALVELTLTPDPAGVNMEYEFDWRLAGDTAWTPLPAGVEPRRRTYLDVGAYNIRGRALAKPFGGPSNWVSADFTVGLPNLTPRVAGLELVGGGRSNVFTGPDAFFTWREGSVTSPGMDNPLGADATQRDPWFAGFRCEMRAADTSLLRVQTVFDPAFAYRLDDNRRDCARNLGLGPQREFSLTVQQLGRHGQEEAQGSKAQTIAVRNPAPAAPSGLSATPFSRAAMLDFTADDGDGDLAGTIVRGSATSGFDAAAGGGEVLYQGNALQHIQIALAAGETKYVQVANFDAFGTDGLNWSSEIAITPAALTDADFSEEVSEILNDAAFTSDKYVWALDGANRILGAVLAKLGSGLVTAAWLVDTFVIAHPDVNGGDPFPVFEVSGGVVRINEAYIELLTVDGFKALWGVVDVLQAGRIESVDGLMFIDFNTKVIQADYAP